MLLWSAALLALLGPGLSGESPPRVRQEIVVTADRAPTAPGVAVDRCFSTKTPRSHGW